MNQHFTIPEKLLNEDKVQRDGLVKVDFPTFEHRNAKCYAVDALNHDPSRFLGICLRGEDWTYWYQGKGDLTAKRANALFDWLTDTGIARSEHKIPRRCYYLKSANGKNGGSLYVRVYT